MASTTITVTVNNGTTPGDIRVSFTKAGIKQGADILSPHSFSHTFDNLESGAIYSVFINGINPAGPEGETTCSITTEDIVLLPTSDDSPTTRKGNAYIVQFQFTTA